ncbi:hypothetical protein AFCDBAGC_1033 [Methylobacterium cerastii]|uniref:Uncharacterized protein n=1 Tax=Methylobacterium cerastii TaxID=932741 RepID=A0ABQ4QDA4_9HYPH|nr:hypothetical protein AFCDBAGC_1033 [Methylobacterium cerastii]
MAPSSVAVPVTAADTTGASLTPLIVNDTTFVVPSAADTVKVSTWVSDWASDCTAALATV